MLQHMGYVSVEFLIYLINYSSAVQSLKFICMFIFDRDKKSLEVFVMVISKFDGS